MTERPEPERTDDGRWLVIGGRRWRANDPTIPDALRAELVAELMDARRAVAAGRRDADDDAVAAARRRVGHAKTALGERGQPWWEEPTEPGRRARLAAAMLALATHRAPKTTCPSDAARAVGGSAWRSTMDEARVVASKLAADGEIDVLQRGQVIDPAATWRGPVRIRRRGAAG